MSQTAPSAFGALNSATVTIAAEPRQVWPILLDRARWVEGFIGKTHLDGPFGEVGERALYTSSTEEGPAASRIEEILTAEIDRRLVTRLAAAESDATYAFAEWRLSPRDDGCALEMNLYWLDYPEQDGDWPAARNLRTEYMRHTQAAIEGHLVRIRAAAES